MLPESVKSNVEPSAVETAPLLPKLNSVTSPVTELKSNTVRTPLPAGTTPPVNEIPSTVVAPTLIVKPASSAAPPLPPVNASPLTSNWKPATSSPKLYKTCKVPEAASNAPSSKLARQDVPSPPHTPHASSTELPFGTPAQSAHEELSPLQTPQSSKSAYPNHSPAQSWSLLKG